MDGTKRKARSSPAPPTTSLPVMDFGTTPPWSLPPTLYPESALRSTQQSPKCTIHPAALHQPTATEPIDSSPWTPLNNSSKQHPPLQARKRIGRRAPEAVGAPIADADENVDVHVDTENDGVYMINAKEGSWSGSLSSEDNPEVQEKLPPQAELALKHLKRAQELAKQQERLKAANIAMEALLNETKSTGMTPEDKAKWQKDLLLRNTMRQIKKKLQQGAALTLEHLGPVNLTMTCAHPLCPAPGKLVPAGAYYVILAQPCQSESVSRYCLFCLEALWNGKGIAGQLPDARVDPEEVKVRQKIPSFCLDGAMDETRLRAAGIAPTPLTMTPASSISTPTSISSPASFHTVSTPPTHRSSAVAPTATSTDNLKSKTFESIYDSPLLRKSQLRKSASQQEDEVFLKSEQSFTDRINKASVKPQSTRNTGDVQPVRRSTRLKSASTSGSSTPSVQMSGSALGKQKEIGLTAAKLSPIDAIADEVRKSDARLEVKYEERKNALPLLKPGEKIMIKHPHCSNYKVKRFVSRDMFGLLYTDLLADHVKYWTKPAAADNYQSSKVAASADVRPLPEIVRSPKWQKGVNAHDRWCICHGLEDGREMIECGNERCLVGWYHMECVDAHVGEDEEWLCPTCISQQAGDGVMLPLTVDPKILKGLLDPPFADQAIYDLGRSAVIKQDNCATFDEAKPASSLLRLDGASDPPPLPYQPPKPSPLSQTHFQIPESLLSSKHAPSAEELSSYPTEQTKPRTPTPALPSLPETPGSPESTKDSMTSTGEWRHPLTRFQYLAKFVRPGNSLNKAEKTAVELWKAASEEQLQWNRFRARYEKTVQELTDQSDHGEGYVSVHGNVGETSAVQVLRDGGRLEDGEIAESNITLRDIGGPQRNGDVEEHADELERELESNAGLPKSQCRGKNLTMVLADVRSRKVDRVE